jgi:methylglutaconyl-CoA hydratase
VARAKELIVTGRRFDAAAALGWGIVTEVVPTAALDAAAQRLADEIAGAAPLAVAQAKAAIDAGAALSLAEALRVERRAYEVVLTSADRDEGLAAFAEKRSPVFQGK